MNQIKINELLAKQEEKYKKLHDSFEIGQMVEFKPDEDGYETNEAGYVEGKIVNKSYGKNGCDLRIDIDGSGTEFWVDAEDVF
jgi:hypothetical protein